MARSGNCATAAAWATLSLDGVVASVAAPRGGADRGGYNLGRMIPTTMAITERPTATDLIIFKRLT